MSNILFALPYLTIYELVEQRVLFTEKAVSREADQVAYAKEPVGGGKGKTRVLISAILNPFP